MTGFWTPIFQLIRRFFSAWAEALVETAPDKLRPYLLWSRPHVTLLASQLAAGVQNAAISGKSVLVQVDPHLCLQYRFSLPVCASSELTRAVMLEAERILPLHISKLKTAFCVTEMDKTKETISVSLVAVRKRLIEDILETLGTSGVPLRAIVALSSGDSGQIEFSVSQVTRLRRGMVLVTAALVFLVVLIGTQMPSFYASRLIAAIEQTDQKIRDARSATRQVASLQNEMRDKKSLSTAIVTVKRQQRITELLNRLTKASPDDVVLETFRIDKDRLNISGIAKDAENWAIALDKIAAFQEVVLVSVRNSSSEGRQRFEMRTRISWQNIREDSR